MAQKVVTKTIEFLLIMGEGIGTVARKARSLCTDVLNKGVL